MKIRPSRALFRHETRSARAASVLTAAALVALMLLGSGPAVADDAPVEPGTAETSTEAPADPAPEPATDPAPEPEAPPATEPEPSGEGEGDGDADGGEAPAQTPEPTVEESEGTETPDGPAFQLEGKSVTAALGEVIAAALVVPCTVTTPPGSTLVGGFEIDGNTCVDSAQDWDSPAGVKVVDELEPLDTTGFTGGSSKENIDPSLWLLGGEPQTKADLETAWAYSKVVSGNVYSYFAFSRIPEDVPGAGGDVTYDVEYNQAANQLTPGGVSVPKRTPGDLLVVVDQGGGTALALQGIYKYTLGTPGGDCFAVTSSSPSASWCPMTPGPAFTSAVNQESSFAEGAIDITALFGPGTCSGSFGVVNVRSRASNSTTSTLQDYVGPLNATTPSTCGKIVIEKDDQDGNPLGGATFSVSPNPDPTLANNVAYSITDNDSKDKNPADGVIEISPVDPNELYTVTETAAPAGYFLANPASQGPVLVGPSTTVTFTFVNHKEWDALTATKTATPSYAASYDWSIIKEIGLSPNGPWYDATTADDPLDKLVPADAPTPGTLYYRTTVTEGAETTSDFSVSGTISVTNPNDDPVTADISDSLPGGTCLVEGDATHTVSVPAGGPTAYDYVCDLGDNPDDADVTGTKTNTASVTWDKSDYPQTGADVGADGDYEINPTDDYAFTTPTSTEDETVTIEDDKTDALDGISYSWTAEGTEHVSDPYSTTSTVVAGSCTPVITNTASVIGDGDDVLDSDSAYGQICLGSDLTISSIDAETLTRTYPWSIEKSTSTPKIYVKDGKAVADYEVVVTAGDGVDSAWNITGTITVDNPNDWESIAVTSLPVTYSGGGTCAVTGEAFPVAIAAADDHVFNYSCNFVDKPDYNGNIVATVNWDAAAAHTPSGSVADNEAVVEADWGVTPVNDTVTVHDDNATPGDTSDDTTWDLTWVDVYGQTDHEEVITYTIDLDVPAIGECDDEVNTVTVVGDNDAVIDADGDAENNSATVEVCNPYTQISALKVDFETGEPLAGAEFTLFQGDTELGTATSGDDGIAVFENKLLPGTYTVKETKAPAGYALPLDGEDTVTVTIDHIEDPDSNFVENGVMAPITFRDPALGQLALLDKQHLERDPATNDWVPSDGAVDFGEEIRYVVPVEVTGPKLFHNVTVTDYVPGFNPADVTSTGIGTYEGATATCSGDFTCTVNVDEATGLVTWELTTEGQDEGVVKGDASGQVEFVVRMPQLPDAPPYVNGVFSVILWNQAYLDWDQQDLLVVAEPPVDQRSGAIVPGMVHYDLSSTEVTDEARAFEPDAPDPCDGPNPPEACDPAGPSPLPETGGPSLALLLLGLGLALGGGGLVVSDRRHRRRS